MNRRDLYNQTKKAIRKGQTELAVDLLKQFNALFEEKTNKYLQIVETPE